MTLSWALAQFRIIPADAGSTNNQRTTVLQGQDHPRGCGEHGLYQGEKATGGGSSPRMRGAHLEILAIPTIQ